MVYYFKFLSSITIYSWNFLEQHTEQGYNVSCSCKIIFQQIRNVLDTTKKTSIVNLTVAIMAHRQKK